MVYCKMRKGKMMTTLQEQIIEALNVKPQIDPETEFRNRVDFLKNFISQTPALGFSLGISGGQDSALAGYIAQTAVKELREETNKPYRFITLLLPYGQQKDGADAQTIAADFIQADVIELFNIKDTVDAFAATYNIIHPVDNLKDYHKGNVKARVRMLTQYAYAGENNLLVVGTDHGSEAVTGFFTKGGDGMADVLPLSGLNKRQGKAILKYLGAPNFVVAKAPTADLLDKTPGQADETELGLTYDIIDDYLEGKNVGVEAMNKIEHRYLMTEHKRQLPVTNSDIWWK